MSIILSNLTLGFGSRIVVGNLSATCLSGKITVVLGPSGAGKSTLLGAIAGYLPLRSGQIDTQGVPNDQIAMITQAASLLTRRTAVDNVALGGLAAGFDFLAATKSARELMATLAMSEVAGIRAHRLSGGERQRIALMRMIERGTRILLADEPSASLDAVSRAAVCEVLRAAADRGAVVLVATHDPYVADFGDHRIDLSSNDVR